MGRCVLSQAVSLTTTGHSASMSTVAAAASGPPASMSTVAADEWVVLPQPVESAAQTQTRRMFFVVSIMSRSRTIVRGETALRMHGNLPT
jgi:hypothetical protein